MSRLWAPLVLAALGVSCSQHHRISEDSEPAQAAAFKYEPRTLRELQDCDGRLGSDVHGGLHIDFGATTPRAHWLLSDEESPFFRAPPRSASVMWRGVQASQRAMHCPAHFEGCTAGGSRLRLEDSSGRDLSVYVHWEPEQLPELALGSLLTLDVDMQRGLLTLSVAEGGLVLAVQRYGSFDAYEAREWSAGPFRIRTDRPVCTGVAQPCNYRLTALALRFDAGGDDSLVLEPAENELFELGGEAYRVSNDMASLHGSADPGAATCGTARGAFDAFSILRL
jgi:hypothetical protein